MKISTRSKYGLQLMVTLARHYWKGVVSLKDIAAEEDISEKYLGQLIIPLKAAGLVHAEQGAYGGYLLARSPKKINVLEIIKPLEGGLVLSKCSYDPSACQRAKRCTVSQVWRNLNDKISETLQKITLEDLRKKENTKIRK